MTTLDFTPEEALTIWAVLAEEEETTIRRLKRDGIFTKAGELKQNRRYFSELTEETLKDLAIVRKFKDQLYSFGCLADLTPKDGEGR